MKKLFSVSLALLLLLLSGCGLLESSVQSMKGWSFQYNEGTNDYSLFFGLCDKNEKYVSADVNVAIRIENENGETVYQGTKSITKNNFGTYSSQVAGERYLADVRIPAAEIQAGSSSSGKVYFTVSNDTSVAFDECNCDALYCLPVLDIQINVADIPVELEQTNYDGSLGSRLLITDVQYSVDYSMSNIVSVVIAGEKTYGQSDGLFADMISYKLYDSEGYMIDSGSIYIGTALNAGDKFKNDSLFLYELVPGQTYTLQLLNYQWL